MSYKLQVLPSVEKQLKRLPKQIAKNMRQRIRDLAADPRPMDAKKLKGRTHFYRIRVSAWRVIYEIRDHQLVVIVVQAGHRREIYRRM